MKWLAMAAAFVGLVFLRFNTMDENEQYYQQKQQLENFRLTPEHPGQPGQP